MKKLIDKYGREITYLRISLTDRCNFRCIYCSPSDKNFCFIKHQNILRFEEILEIAQVAVKMGMTKIRLTGGEPLVRKGVIAFIEKLRAIEGLEDISMTTNGYYLSEMAESLKKAGLNRVNISLDSLQREKFKMITGFDGLERVLQAIDSSLELGLEPVKINVVLLKGINDDEVENFIQLTYDKPLYVRFIELMPTNHELTQINQGHFVSADIIKKKMKMKFPDLRPISIEKGYGPAVYYQLPGAKGMVGFITAVSQHFCAKCNRIRLTAEGKIRPCLFNSREVEIRDRLRKIPMNEKEKREKTIQYCLEEAIKIKPFRHHIGNKNLSEFDMSKIGG
ncbi:MAG: GTP 3',8-cyclase MoaA [Atribacterota bacterium]|nr:GTP 3',8-cyclase MoaA [Atribacterota bacterium]